MWTTNICSSDSDNAVPYLSCKFLYQSGFSFFRHRESKHFLQSDSKIMHFLLNMTPFSADFECGPLWGRGGEYQGSG